MNCILQTAEKHESPFLVTSYHMVVTILCRLQINKQKGTKERGSRCLVSYYYSVDFSYLCGFSSQDRSSVTTSSTHSPNLHYSLRAAALTDDNDPADVNSNVRQQRWERMKKSSELGNTKNTTRNKCYFLSKSNRNYTDSLH